MYATNSSPIAAVIAPAVCRSTAPRPNESRPQTARNRPPPITARSTPGWPSAELMCWVDRMACPDEVADERRHQPDDQRYRREYRALAPNQTPRRGMTDSDVLIMPVEYSDVIVIAPSTAMTSWPRISPNRLISVACEMNCGPLVPAGREPGIWLKCCAWRRQNNALSPIVMTASAISDQ